MRSLLFVVLLCGVTTMVSSVKDEKELLKAIEQFTGDSLAGLLITRDPFSWPLQRKVDVSKGRVIVQKKRSAEPSFAWSLTGVSKTKRGLYALVGNGKNTKLARVDEELGDGWSISSITQQGMVCKHSSGFTRELHV
jgi:hypothetical protein